MEKHTQTNRNYRNKVVMTNNQIKRKTSALKRLLKAVETRQYNLNILRHPRNADVHPILDRLQPLVDKFTEAIKSQIQSLEALTNCFLALRIDYQKLYNKQHKETRIAHSQLKKFEDTLDVYCPFKIKGQHNGVLNCILCYHKSN